MADAYTGTGAVAWDQAAWNRYLFFGFREENVFDQCADVKPTAQTNPGATVGFFLANDLAPVSTALNESLDVDAVALTDSTVTVTLAEEGNAVVETQKLRLTSMIPTDPAIANILGQNAGESVDVIVRDILKAGTNVGYSGGALTGARNTLAAADVLKTADVRMAKNRLRRNKVPKKDGLYNAYAHPDAIYDLQGETGGIGWMESHKYVESGVSKIYAGEVGVYQGFRFIDTVNAPVFVNASNGAGASGNIDVYRTLFMGAQALAKGYSNADGYGPMPITVKGPVVDKLERFQPWGWKHFVGYGIFRQAAIWAVEHASSAANNAS